MRSLGVRPMQSTVSGGHRRSLADLSRLCNALLCVLLAAFVLLLVSARADLPGIAGAFSGGIHLDRAVSPTDPGGSPTDPIHRGGPR